MNLHLPNTFPIRSAITLVLAIVTAIAPSASLFAQGYGAQQAVRQRVSGLGTPEEPSEQPFQPPTDPGPYAPPTAESSPGSLDIRYVTPTSSVVVVLRPAQILGAPTAELLPREVATAAGQAYLGIDPATVEEVVAFVDLANPIAPAYGATIKFNQPFRGSSIPPHARPAVQLAELAGRKYLQSAHPLMPSFYGTSKTTLIVAPDATLRPLIESSDQPKSGPLIERIRNVSAGHDLYVAIDVASLRPFVQMAKGAMPANVPPDAKAMFEVPNLISAAELTLNMSAPGPTSLVLHANDEAAAQQLETMMAGFTDEGELSPEAMQLAAMDPVAQAMTSYRERMKQLFRHQRNGTSVTCFQIDGNNPAQQQVVSAIVVGLTFLAPALKAAGQAAQQAQAMQPQEQPPEQAPDQPQEQLPETPPPAEPGL